MIAAFLHGTIEHRMSLAPSTLKATPQEAALHTPLEDVQGILTGTLFVALSLVFFRSSGLLPGGIAGLSFLVTYSSGWSLGAVYTEVLPHLVSFATLNPAFSAVMGGLLAGGGILMLIRHGASLGGLGVLAIYLQQRKGWRAGTVQMICDLAILALAMLVVAPEKVLLSILAAVALNFVIAINHRPDRYFGI